METRDFWNASRFRPGSGRGHYESWFQRANHPTRPLGFWIRYTIFAPAARPADAIGELWAIWFDGERGQVTAAKSEVPLERCSFSTERLQVRVGEARLTEGELDGAAESGGHRIDWSLGYAGGQAPLLLLPRRFYDLGFPKAKAVVPAPLARFAGEVVVDGERHAVEGWPGSQNHNWGARHTDHYAWGQVAGFDEAPETFLECTTARVRVGPLWTPFLTLAVVRVDGETLAVNALGRAVRAKAGFEYFDWHFDTREGDLRLQGHIHAPRDRFVALRYGNPPGGAKTCLNSKIAACELTLERKGRPKRTLHSAHRAAFEILTDDESHGLSAVA